MRYLILILPLLLFSCKKKDPPPIDNYTLEVIESNTPTISIDCGSGNVDTVKLKYSYWIYKGTQTFTEYFYNSDLSKYQGANFTSKHNIGNVKGYTIGFNGAGFVNGTKSTSGCDITHKLKLNIYKNNVLIYERSSDYSIEANVSL